jgi:hypothetical protein
MTQPEKKQWQQPHLIVLVRNEPQESVLLACKSSTAAVGPGTFHTRCTYFCNLVCQSQGGGAVS